MWSVRSEDRIVISELSSFIPQYTTDHHVQSTHLGSSSIGLSRFLKVCQEMEADLRAISFESKRKHFEVKSLSERALLKLSDFRDEREFLHRTGENNSVG